MGKWNKFPLSGWEVAVAAGIVASFGLGLMGVYLSMPASDYSFLKLPRTLEELQILRDHLESYTSDYTIQVLVGYCTVYIFMQTFMIPGTIFMSLLAGSLFGVFRGVALVVFAATAGASSCYFLSNLIGRPLVFSLWPDKLNFFQAQVTTTWYFGSYILQVLTIISVRCGYFVNDILGFLFFFPTSYLVCSISSQIFLVPENKEVASKQLEILYKNLAF